MKLAPLIAIMALLSSAAPGYAQGGQDFSKVEIKTNKVTDKFFTLDGQGGTIGVLIGPDGVFMVDTQFAPLSDKIAAAIKQLTPQPIKFVVNTHVHGDHTGGDENFGRMGATIITASAPSFSSQTARLKNSHHTTMASVPRTPPMMAMAPTSGKIRGATNRIRHSSTATTTPGHNRRGLCGADAMVCWLVINGPDASGVQLVP